MENKLLHQHIVHRIKIILLAGIATFVLLFGLMYILDELVHIETLYAQITLLVMAAITIFTYIAILPASDKLSIVPAISFVVLNLLTTVLVWQTGILQSPFIVLYVILVIIGTQLYRYVYGLVHIVLALAGYLLVFGAVTQQVLPFMTLLPYSGVHILFQPLPVIIIYGLLYVILLVFTVMSSSNARMMLYRPQPKLDMDTTYQEKIIQDMPVGVLVVDANLTILGTNPWVNVHFPISSLSTSLHDYLSFEKVKDIHARIISLAHNLEDTSAQWRTETGEVNHVTVSVRSLGAKKDANTTFIVFIR